VLVDEDRLGFLRWVLLSLLALVRAIGRRLPGRADVRLRLLTIVAGRLVGLLRGLGDTRGTLDWLLIWLTDVRGRLDHIWGSLLYGGNGPEELTPSQVVVGDARVIDEADTTLQRRSVEVEARAVGEE
jgi:hypothetical protein